MLRPNHSPSSTLTRAPLRWAWLLIAWSLVVSFASPARAELLDDAERVVRLWSGGDARVERAAPLFLEHGRQKVIVLDPVLPATNASLAQRMEACTSVLFLGAHSVDFAIASADEPLDVVVPPDGSHVPGSRGDPHDDDHKARSAAGAILLVRCGDARRELGHLVIEMLSPRGTIETIVARTMGQARDLREILPERVSGPVAPRGDPGRPVEPGPLAERLARVERTARQDGAEKVSRVTMRAASTGVGEFVLKLGAGCHHLAVMAEVPATFPHRATDVDAELRDMMDDRMIARDRADTPDARFEACFGEPTVVSVRFTGASGDVEVAASDAVWPISTSMPAHWGSRARAGFAGAFERRHMPDPRGPPIAEGLGVQGLTSVGVELVPGACYVASVAIIRGDVRGIRLTAHVGERAPRDEVTEHADGASVAFCAEAATTAHLDVELRGSSPWWVFAVWPMATENP